MSEYLKQAKEFLEKTGTEMKLVQTGVVNGFPFSKSDNHPHNKYRVILIRANGSYDFDFYDSYQNYINHKKPTAYDVLACLEKYEYPTDPWEFADEFGYEIKSKEDYEFVRKIAESCREQYDALVKLYGKDIELLQEIQ